VVLASRKGREFKVQYCTASTNPATLSCIWSLTSGKGRELKVQYNFYEDEVSFRKGREFKVFFIWICIIEKKHLLKSSYYSPY
jgi:hypothetical protein